MFDGHLPRLIGGLALAGLLLAGCAPATDPAPAADGPQAQAQPKGESPAPATKPKEAAKEPASSGTPGKKPDTSSPREIVLQDVTGMT